MRKIGSFCQVSLDGYYCDARGEMSWAHKQDAEWGEFTSQNAKRGGGLLFGRVTYEMMASYWPTPAAFEQNAQVAEAMCKLPKYVVSRTLESVSWTNSTLLGGDLIAAVRRLKHESGPDLTILGSGSVVAQLTAAGLIDEYQMVINPIVLGSGRALFQGLSARVPLVLRRTQSFKNGNVVLSYAVDG